MAINESIREKIIRDFLKNFKNRPVLFRSPGRVNIIGEHTDYNQGFVLPAAIDKAIYVAVSPREDNRILLYSGAFGESFETDLDALYPTDRGWPNYVLGVADQLLKRKFPLKGFDLVVDGDVPIGSGLSSSAAVECATAFALNELFGMGISKLDLALIAQKAEHEFAGVMCGIMDQFASMFGKKDHVIKLDCKSLDYEYVPLDLKEYVLLLMNTNVKHSLASSAYNQRRQECEQGVAWVKGHFPEVHSLRDVTMEQLDQWVRPKDELIYMRCKYVVEEKDRLLQACEDLTKGDLISLGQKMFRTHEGLSKEYEVSCPELDFLVNAVKNDPDVIGARMMGGGFGGCTINIVKESAVNRIIEQTGISYQETMNRSLTPYIAKTENGSCRID